MSSSGVELVPFLITLSAQVGQQRKDGFIRKANYLLTLQEEVRSSYS